MESQPTKEQLLELLRYYDSTRLRALQTQLTKSRNQIRDVTSGRLAPLFSPAELETLRQASGLLASLSGRVEKAKEVRQREEERQKREWEAKQREAHRIVNQYFNPALEGTAEALEAAAVFIVIHDQELGLWRGATKATDHLVGDIEAFIRRKDRKVRHAIRWAWSELQSQLRDWITRFEVQEMAGEAQKLLARVNDAIPDTKRRFARDLDFIHTQLVIEDSENVTRLPEQGKNGSMF